MIVAKLRIFFASDYIFDAVHQKTSEKTNVEQQFAVNDPKHNQNNKTVCQIIEKIEKQELNTVIIQYSYYSIHVHVNVPIDIPPFVNNNTA